MTGQTGGFVVHSVATLVIHCLTLRLTRPSFTLFASRLSTGPSLVSLRYSRYTPYARLRLTPSPTGSEKSEWGEVKVGRVLGRSGCCHCTGPLSLRLTAPFPSLLCCRDRVAPLRGGVKRWGNGWVEGRDMETEVGPVFMSVSLSWRARPLSTRFSRHSLVGSLHSPPSLTAAKREAFGRKERVMRWPTSGGVTWEALSLGSWCRDPYPFALLILYTGHSLML